MERKSLSYQRREAFEDAYMIIIGYEGKRKEPKYFYQLEEKLIEPRKAFIHPLPPINGESAPKKVLERVKAFINDPQRGVNIEQNDIVWFVLDVDRYPLEQFEKINEFCNENDKRNLAISNPCFEIWLWMHFADISKVKSKTSKELKEELQNITSSQSFNGDYTPLIDKAVERARNVDDSITYFPNERSTKVYLLVEDLLKYRK